MCAYLPNGQCQWHCNLDIIQPTQDRAISVCKKFMVLEVTFIMPKSSESLRDLMQIVDVILPEKDKSAEIIWCK